MHECCKLCDLKQVQKIADLINMSEKDYLNISGEVKEYLENVNMERSNPDVMGDIWYMVCGKIKDEDPYREIKQYYNNSLLEIYDDIKDIIDISKNRFNTALKAAITGNLIDFSAPHKSDFEILKDRLLKLENTKLAIDDSDELLKKLKSSNTLLYLGDNCGEIVLDKIFIEEIKRINPNLKVYFGVRGQAIVNDVTETDAIEAEINNVAEVISNGDGSLGTELQNTSSEFNKIFKSADMVICKGQGNYESLMNCPKKNMFFLFMAKCDLIAGSIGKPVMSIICFKKSIKFDIKAAKISDEYNVKELLNRAALKLIDKGIKQWEYPWDINEIQQDIARGNLYTCKIGDSLLGTFCLGKRKLNYKELNIDGEEEYLYRIAVDPLYQGTEVGKEIMRWVLRYAEVNNSKVYLDCWAGNDVLKRFYSNDGFNYLGDASEEDYFISVFVSGK